MRPDPKQYVQKYFMFISLMLLSVVFITIAFDHITNTYSFIFKKDRAFNTLIERYGHVRYLFLGDSHTETGIDPSKVDDLAFNYGIGGETFIDNYYRLKYFIDRSISIDMVVLEIDWTMAENRDTFEKEAYFLRNYMSLHDIAAYDGHKLPLLINHYFGFIGRGSFFGLVFTKGKAIDHQGFTELNGSLPKTSKKTVSPEPQNGTSFTYLQKIIALCEQAHISLLLIKYPQYTISTHTRYYQQLETVLRTMPGTYHIFDYQDLFNSPGFFNDTTHLNHVGATIVARRFVRDLKKRTQGERATPVPSLNSIERSD